MSRDPYDDPYPNDPDRAERERDGGGYDDRRAGRDAKAVGAARGAVAAPGLFLILNGLFGLFCAALLSVPMVFQPEMIIKFGRDMAAQQPAGPDRQKLEQQMDDAENQLNQNRVATQVQNAIELGVLVLGNLLAVVGGFAMRGLGNYGLSMAGAIISIVPCLTGCCITGILFGIWAVVTLARPDVKAGFAARRRGASAPDPY